MWDDGGQVISFETLLYDDQVTVTLSMNRENSTTIISAENSRRLREERKNVIDSANDFINILFKRGIEITFVFVKLFKPFNLFWCKISDGMNNAAH